MLTAERTFGLPDGSLERDAEGALRSERGRSDEIEPTFGEFRFANALVIADPDFERQRVVPMSGEGRSGEFNSRLRHHLGNACPRSSRR
jgi:hypothetical protein